MPTGDSITEGWGSSDETGPRDELLDKIGTLDIQGLLGVSLDSGAIFKRVDFVGERRNGTRGDPDHMGFPGDTIDQIRATSLPAMARLRPTVVTLLAGTNDMILQVDVVRAPERLSGFLTAIFAASPGVVIVVGTLPPSTDAASRPGSPPTTGPSAPWPTRGSSTATTSCSSNSARSPRPTSPTTSTPTTAATSRSRRPSPRA